MKRVGTIGLALSVLLMPAKTAFAADFEAPPADFEDRWNAWVGGGGYYGTDDNSYGELILFGPLYQDGDTVFFTDARGKYFEHEAIEGNLAFGVRQMTASGFNFGAWVGVDGRRTASDNFFGQVSGGLEALSEYFDARVNGYVPFSDSQAADPSFADVILDGPDIFMVGGEEVALHGVDGEVGGRLPFMGNRAILSVYGGGFWFDSEDAFEEIAGPKARAELAVADIIGPGSQISGRYQFTHDDVRGDRHTIGARLRIPLGGSPRPAESMTGQEWRMMEGLERDTDIVIGQSDEEAVEDAWTDVDFERVAYVDGGTAGGISAVATSSGSETLIIANGGNGFITGPQVLQANQTLQGGDLTIEVRGLESGTVASFTAPGSRPTLSNSADSAILRLASNTHAVGLSILGSGNDALFSNDGVVVDMSTNVLIEQLSVTDAGSRGILLDNNNTGVLVDSVIVTNSGSAGIQLNNDNVGNSITNVTVVGSGFVGIQFNNDNIGNTLVGATVTNSDFVGIQVNNRNIDTTIRDVTVAGAGFQGIDVNNDNIRTVVSDASVSGTVNDGISVSNQNVDTSISDVTINNAGDQGLSIQNGNINTSVARATISASSQNGIFIDHDNSVSMVDVTVVGAGGDGLATGIGNSNTISLTDSIFVGNFGDDIVDINQTGNTLSGSGNTAAEAIFGGQFCEVTGAQTGQFVFDIGACPP